MFGWTIDGMLQTQALHSCVDVVDDIGGVDGREEDVFV